MTDARHGTRKNARQTDVICLGNSTQKVVAYHVVTSEDDPVAQRHELLGTKKIYQELTEKGVSIRRHAHDNNASITKYVREIQTQTENQLDNWHALKQLEKALKAISTGPKKYHRVKWHHELEDKPHAVRTHAYHSLINCEQDPNKLRVLLINCVQHYRGNHTACNPQSRCRRQADYEPRHQMLQEDISVSLLTKAIEDSIIFKKAELFVHNMSTAQVDSFNNSLNVVHDKRISFSMQSYKMRTALSVGFWNDSKKHFCHSVWKTYFIALNQ